MKEIKKLAQCFSLLRTEEGSCYLYFHRCCSESFVLFVCERWVDEGCYSDGDIIIVPHSFEVLLSHFRAFFSKQHTFGCIYFLLISTFWYVNKRGCFLHCVHCAWMRAIGTYASRVQVLGSFFCLLWNFAGLRAPLSIMRMSHPLCPPSPPAPLQLIRAHKLQ